MTGMKKNISLIRELFEQSRESFVIAAVLLIIVVSSSNGQTVTRSIGADCVGYINEFNYWNGGNPSYTFVSWNITGNYTIVNDNGALYIELYWNEPGNYLVRANYIYPGIGAVQTDPVEVNIPQSPVPTINGPDAACPGSGGNVYTTESGQSGYYWQITGGTINSGASTNSVSVTWNAIGTQQLSAYYASGGCSAGPGVKSVRVGTLASPGTLDGLATKLVYQGSSPGEITASSPTGGINYQYQWQQSPDNINWQDIPGATSASYTPGVITSDQYFRRKVASCNINGPVYYTSSFYAKINNSFFSEYTHIRTNTIQVSGVTESAEVEELSHMFRLETVQYFDGLGRPMQTVNRKTSPNEKDIVLPVQYDAYGRETKKYLPYISDENNGQFKKSAFTQQVVFYANPPLGVATDIQPYAETIFEPSPLNKVLKQGAPGEAWQPGSDPEADRSIKRAYEFNKPEDVFLLKYDPETEELLVDTEEKYYTPKQLYANKTMDEHNNEIIEYIDKEGRTLCKKVQYGTNGSTRLYAETYYVYNDFGNLVLVLQPEGVKQLKQSLGEN